ncbi:MAG: DMT family transporter [Chloroflexi bacterium]|nr:DMT family transporter [Chloroflexota bacterium]
MPTPAPAPVATVATAAHLPAGAPAENARPRSAYLAILFGVFIFVFASPLVRVTLDAGLPPMVIAAGRPLLAWLILSVILLRRPSEWASLRQLSRRQLALAALGGTLLGLYFMMMTLSLRATDVLITQAVINTGPLWIALLEVSVLREHLRRGVWIGLCISVSGGVVVAAASIGQVGGSAGIPSLPGVGFALLSTLGFAGYMIVGRGLRRVVPLVSYLWLVMGFATLSSSLMLWVSGTPLFGHSSAAFFWLVVMTLLTQLVGHGIVNYCIVYFPATLLAMIGPVISVGSAVVAFLLFAEMPTGAETLGSLILMSGVLYVILSEARAGRASRAKREPAVAPTALPGSR